MNSIKIAKSLIKIAEQLMAEQEAIAGEEVAFPTQTRTNFEEYSKDYFEKYGEEPDEKLWDIFETQEQVDAFLQNKAKDFPHLRQIISEETIERLLNNDWFIIISAGRNDSQSKNPSLITDEQIKQRYNELKRFLQSLNLPYYEVIGQYFHSSELSYIVDLSDNGTNDENTIKSNLRKIRSFCGTQLKQDAVIQGLGKQRVYMYTNNAPSYHIKTNELPPQNDVGRSQVFTDKSNRRKNKSWADNYNFQDDPSQGDWI